MSKLVETRAEFQRLAEERLDEAQVLLAAKKWSGAYYLAGYAVELGLKACIIKMLVGRDKFPEKELSKDCYTHSLTKLVETAGLADALDAAIAADPILSRKWAVVTGGWSEEKRYFLIPQDQAERLMEAIADPAHGVFPWIKTHW